MEQTLDVINIDEYDMKKILFLFLVFLVFLKISSQERFRVMFYNIENLYDTIRNVQIEDEEYTPDGNMHWNAYKYKKKLESLAQVLNSIDEGHPPALVGLCEVENKRVLQDLLATNHLKKHKYSFTMTGSRDYRGSNTALLYQKDQFRLLQKRTYRPKLKNGTTRDILHVMGKVVSGDTLDIFVCHFPSRGGGVKKTESNRLDVSSFLQTKIKQTKKQRLTPRIIVMGDFNDTPHDKGIKSLTQNTQLFNLFYDSQDPIKSYYYRGDWEHYDQFMVSKTLLDESTSCFIEGNKGATYAPDFLLEFDEKYQQEKPFRTYSGWKYLGGYSDHLPIYFDLIILEE